MTWSFPSFLLGWGGCLIVWSITVHVTKLSMQRRIRRIEREIDEEIKQEKTHGYRL